MLSTKGLAVFMRYPARCGPEIFEIAAVSSPSAGSSALGIPLGEISRGADLCGVDVKVTTPLVGVL